MRGEPPSVSSQSMPTARKEHKCVECRGTIFKGEAYYRFQGCWDGQWGDVKTCFDCQHLRKEVDSEIKDPDDRPPFGELYEDIFEDRSASAARVLRFMEIRRKRNAPESPRGWMEKIEAEILAGKEGA